MDKKARFKWIDVVLILLCVAAGVYAYFRIKYGLKRDIDFISLGQFMFRRSEETGRLVPNLLIVGLVATLKLSVWALISATIVGVIFGIFRTSGNLFLRMVGRTYVEMIRNVPPLVLIYIFYFFVADQIMPLLGVEAFMRGLPEGGKTIMGFLFAEESLFVQFLSGIMTLAFFEGAYITEVVRAGIESIETGQRQAAYSLGLSWLDQMRFIIMPQAIKRVMPALAGEFISTIKYSSITSTVSIQELTYMGLQVNLITSSFLALWITVSAMYMVLTFSISLVANRLEERMARSD